MIRLWLFLFLASTVAAHAQTPMKLFGRGLKAHEWTLALACEKAVAENEACDVARFILSPVQGEPHWLGPRIILPIANQTSVRAEAIRLKLMYFFATRRNGESVISQSEAHALLNRITDRNQFDWSVRPKEISLREMTRLTNLIASMRGSQLGNCSKYGQKLMDQMFPLQEQGVDFQMQSIFQSKDF